MKEPFAPKSAACLLLAMAISLSPALAHSAQPDQTTQAVVVPSKEEVLQLARRSGEAQVAQLQADEAAGRRGTGPDWVSAVFFTGAMKLATATDVPKVLDYSLKAARRFSYAHQGDGAPVHLINADDQAIGDLYQSAFFQTGAPGTLMPLKQRLDYTLPYLSLAPEPKRLVWWWCDALFMAPPVLARMSAITGDRRYLDAMDAQYWRVYDHLYDKDEHLFARDARFVTRRSPNGRKIFWGRGEGWVIGGLARVLEVMPADYPSRPRYVALFRESAKRIISLQHEDGLWGTNLLEPDLIPGPETSGSALFTYALAFGINHGLLDRQTYLSPVLRAWAGLGRHLLPSGILGQVQTTGDQPVPTRPETTGLYASGAFLIAGVEVSRLSDAQTPLPVPLPAIPKLQYRAASWSGAPLPPDATPEQVRERARVIAERQAVVDQAFDPMVDDPHYTAPIPLAAWGTR
ncbi:glycoside hydrolase family 88/105 protein [Novosphingobium terrae]|uniref:glycoside hydrolase family 88/105 protein n=1 Tax=Novosphingobium terrae TaxID=2726189 RepID=UPI00197ECC55|nr:glycoside hydrolase family 88 protein [Novosphingobium terrae]